MVSSRSCANVTGRALFLSLVHPDFLPSLYAVAQVMRDADYQVDLFSFSSPVPAAHDVGPGIVLHDLGPHQGGWSTRFLARRKFRRTVSAWSAHHATSAIIATCPFSLLVAVDVARGGVPVVYLAYETYEATWRDFARSPTNTVRNWRVLRCLTGVDVVCAPSEERAEWLQRQARLKAPPHVVLNAPYVADANTRRASDDVSLAELFGLLGTRRVVIHTGNVSGTQVLLELIDSAQGWPEETVLVVTNVRDTDYGQAVRSRAAASPRSQDILLLPTVKRDTMLALQARAVVGVCLLRASDNLGSSIPAPNKVGEYLHAGLITVANESSYMRVLEREGVAVLARSLEPLAIAEAVMAALRISEREGARQLAQNVARSWYHMGRQFAPILEIVQARRQCRSGPAGPESSRDLRVNS